MPVYKIRVEAQYETLIVAESEEAAHEQAISVFHDNYAVASVSVAARFGKPAETFKCPRRIGLEMTGRALCGRECHWLGTQWYCGHCNETFEADEVLLNGKPTGAVRE